MENKKFLFYVLSSSEDPENVRYVGVTTKKINERFSLHKYCAMHPEKRGLPVHKWMYSKYKQGGTILFTKIDECTYDCWEERELYWIKYYKDLGYNLLNISKGSAGVITKKMRSKSSVLRSIKGHEVPVIALSKDGVFFKRFESSIKAVEYFNVSYTSITNVLNGWSKSSCGYLWVREKDYNPLNNYKYSSNSGKNKIQVYEFSLTGTLIKIWDKINDFQNIKGYSTNGVRAAIRDKREYHGSYFSFENHIDITTYKSSYKFYIKDNPIKYFKSLRELAKFLNISESSLSVYLKKHNTININGFEIVRM